MALRYFCTTLYGSDPLDEGPDKASASSSSISMRTPPVCHFPLQSWLERGRPAMLSPDPCKREGREWNKRGAYKSKLKDTVSKANLYQTLLRIRYLRTSLHSFQRPFHRKKATLGSVHKLGLRGPRDRRRSEREARRTSNSLINIERLAAGGEGGPTFFPGRTCEGRRMCFGNAFPPVYVEQGHVGGNKYHVLTALARPHSVTIFLEASKPASPSLSLVCTHWIVFNKKVVSVVWLL